MKRAAASCVALALAGCQYLTSSYDTNEFSGDPFPIAVDTASGAIIVGVQEEGTTELRTAVLDVMSPLTLIDRGAAAPVRIDNAGLTIFGARVPGGPLDLPRAQVPNKQIVTLHPCDTPECVVGPPATPQPFDALVGLDTFSGDALRLRLASDQIFILPDVAGSDTHRGRSCDSVLDSPFRGGGTLVIGGTEIGFTNWRIAIDSCIKPRPDALITQAARGLDVLLVLSTSVGPSLLSAGAYERYRLLDATAPALDTLPEETVFLPSGPIVGRRTTLPSIALVSNSSSNRRAPCRQMWASHLLGAHDCVPGDDCPCYDGETFCPVPALVELAPTGEIPFLVVAEDEPALVALRTELHPDRPDVDGILGSEALGAVELDIDYPHDRLLARCTDRTTCGARIALPDRAGRRQLNGCLGDMPGPIVLQE